MIYRPDNPNLNPDNEASDTWKKTTRLQAILDAGLVKLNAYRKWHERERRNPEGDRINNLITQGINAIRSGNNETLDKMIKRLEKEGWERWAKDHFGTVKL